jgi:hypothetical protein
MEEKWWNRRKGSWRYRRFDLSKRDLIMKTMKIIIISIILSISIKSESYGLYETSEGKNVRWRESYIEIVLDDSMEGIGDKNDVEYIIKESFNLWINDANLPFFIEIFWDDCSETLNDDDNCIFVVYEDCNRPKNKAATTYLNVIPSTGKIIGFDVIINAEDWDWDLFCKDKDGLCLQRVMLHEFGHILGIGHSDNHDAIMYKLLLNKYDKAKELHQDDIDAADALYSNFIVEERDFYELACSSSIIGNDNSNSIFDLFFIVFIRRFNAFCDFRPSFWS